MTLTKNRMVSEIGRRSRLKNRDVQLMLETLIDVWTEELIAGGRIELENFLVVETKVIDRGPNCGTLKHERNSYGAPQVIRKLIVRPSKKLKASFVSKIDST